MHAAHPGTSHDNTKPCMMRLIINASLKQVNLVWPTVSVLKAEAPASYPGNLLLSFALQGLYTGLDCWCRFLTWAHHTFTSPYPMPFTSITLSLVITSPPTHFLTHQEIVSFYSHFSTELETRLSKSLSNEANLPHFKETVKT